MASTTILRPLPENINFLVSKKDTASTSDVFTFSETSERHILFIFGGNANSTGCYLVAMYSAGNTYTTPILVGSELTLTTGNKTLTISHTSGKYTYFDIALNGSNAQIS